MVLVRFVLAGTARSGRWRSVSAYPRCSWSCSRRTGPDGMGHRGAAGAPGGMPVRLATLCCRPLARSDLAARAYRGLAPLSARIVDKRPAPTTPRLAPVRTSCARPLRRSAARQVRGAAHRAAGRFHPTPPVCYLASWQLPGPDFHRQATTSLRTTINHLHGQPPLCWAHRKGSVAATGSSRGGDGPVGSGDRYLDSPDQ